MDKRYEHKQAEPLAQEKWQTEKTYKAENNPGPLYSIDTPPPTVSGRLHIGHIFSYTQTDIIARYKRMMGFSVFYPFGFDDNGLPTERYVEKKHKVRAHTMPRSEFMELCLKETHTTENEFKKLWQQVGLSVDWDHCYSTIASSTRKIAQESFIQLYKKGFVFRKYEPALYCIACRTSVAQAELDNMQQESFFNDIVFKDKAGNELIVGTTRPELLSSCVALLYNPSDTRYQHLNGTHATVPIFKNEVPIVQDELVETDKGTGLVMCCTFGDKTDIVWYKKFNFPYKQSIGFDGKWAKNTGILAGLNTTNARTTILQELHKHNLLRTQKPITHTVNVHERCKKEIEYVALSQWFLNILEHKKLFLQQAESINWYPRYMKARYINWVENLSWDWCLSRQRFYGIPFPAWHCDSCDYIILADSNDLPIDPQETACTKKCLNCGGSSFKPDTDVMDTWNTSSLTPYICYKLFNNKTKSALSDPKINSFLPMSLRPQAHDIIRTWAFYTIVKTTLHHNTIPWKDIVISGHVLSDTKEKLSKSKGGGKLAPETLLKQYPADVIRYWTASGSLGQDIAFSENQLKIGRRLLTKIWNAFRFLKPHIIDVDQTTTITDLGTVNEWIMHKASDCFTDYNNYFNNHEFGLALSRLEKFFWSDVCDTYFELIKHQLFNPTEYSEKSLTATRWTLYQIGLRILQLYAPYLPHITETIYGLLYSKKQLTTSIHQTHYKNIQQSYLFDESVITMNTVIEITSSVRKLKTHEQLSLKTPLEILTICVQSDEQHDAAKSLEQLICGVTQATKIRYLSKKSSTPTSLQQVNDQWHATVALDKAT